MNQPLLPQIDGKSIIVHNFTIETDGEALTVRMSCADEDQNTYWILFRNVSKLKLSEISYPFTVCGFEILDYQARGYQKDSRFFVNDYEDGMLSFYCENFEIFDRRLVDIQAMP